MIASLKTFGKYPVEIHALYMLVICCIMFSVACCSNCAFILLAPGAFFEICYPGFKFFSHY